MQQRIGRLYSKEAPPILAVCIAIASLNAAAEPLVCFQALHEPMDGQLHCVIKKGFSWRGRKEFFPYRIFEAVLIPIYQGTEVTIVTEYVFFPTEAVGQNKAISS